MPYYPNNQESKNLIPYDSPSGTINIGKWVPPFVEIEGGYGFVGVVAEDSESGKLQCHVCGKWFEQLATHYSAMHGLDGVQYRARFGLLQSTALKSMRIRKAHSKTLQRLQKEGVMQLGNSNGHGFTPKNKHAGNRDGLKKATESQNKFGVCDLQVATKIKALSIKLGKTPSLNEIIAEYGQSISGIIHQRYASYITLCKTLGLEPLTSAHNPKYSREYFIDKGVELYRQHGKLRAKTMLSESEQRHIYTYLGSWKNWKIEVEKKLNANQEK